MAFWNTSGGIATIIISSILVLTGILKWGFDINLFEKTYEFSQYIYSTIGSNFAIFGIFLYLIVISFFLNDNPKVDSSIFYILLIIVPLLASGFYMVTAI